MKFYIKIISKLIRNIYAQAFGGRLVLRFHASRRRLKGLGRFIFTSHFLQINIIVWKIYTILQQNRNNYLKIMINYFPKFQFYPPSAGLDSLDFVEVVVGWGRRTANATKVQNCHERNHRDYLKISKCMCLMMSNRFIADIHMFIVKWNGRGQSRNSAVRKLIKQSVGGSKSFHIYQILMTICPWISHPRNVKIIQLLWKILTGMNMWIDSTKS